MLTCSRTLFCGFWLRPGMSLTLWTKAVIDWDYFSDPRNTIEIINNIKLRKISCDILEVKEQLKELHKVVGDTEKFNCLKSNLSPLLYWFPNKAHPRVLQNISEVPIVIKKIGHKPPFSYFPAHFESLTKRLNALRTKNLGNMCGNKSYYLKNDLAVLEQALIRFAVMKLLQKGFKLVSVPDILHKSCLEDCGMKTQGQHSQVYHIDESWGNDLSLSGTSEMALASYISSKVFQNGDLPLRLCAISRCYRAEANRHQKEKGIFRVHHFSKVEMFGVTANESSTESENLLYEFTQIQEEIYSELGLHFKILEMPPCDLGLPAYHKIDMETWIPTQKIYGEITSASNCTDYQSRRLNIKYISSSTNQYKFCHTVNGTACAIPRLLIAIFENFQNLDGSINIPKPLQKHFGKDIISGKFKEILLCTKPVP